MTRPVKTRRYDNQRRTAAAALRRHGIIQAAAELFTERGYARTSIDEVAIRAGVAPDTVYAAVGRKPQLLLAAHDLLLAEGRTDDTGGPVAASQRQYVHEVRAASGARAKIAAYAQGLARVLPRAAPLLEALREAGRVDQECRAVWESVERRRAANMRLLARDLRDTGELREDLDNDTVADLIWSMNSSAYYTSLTSRGWTPERYTTMLADLLTCTLVAAHKDGRHRRRGV